MRTLVIPDVHVKPEHVDFSHLEALARYICYHKPENVVFIGDFWDMPAIYTNKRANTERGKSNKKAAEGRRIWADIEAGKRAFNIIIDAIRRKQGYSPNIHFCEGNHEYELKKYFDERPEAISPTRSKKETVMSPTNLEDFIRGRKIRFHPFLEVFDIEGVIFSHYFRNDNGNAVQISTAHSNLYRYSHVWGHSHKWGYKQDSDQMGGKIFWLCTGTFRRPGGIESRHWSGISILHHNCFGDADVEQVSVERLMSEFS